jgi:putative hemolysin
MGIGKMNAFLQPLHEPDAEGRVFEVAQELLSFEVGTAGRERLEKAGLSRGCVMVANHPRGILDVFATGAWFSANTPLPVKCIGNRAIVRFVPALKPYVVGVNNMGMRGQERRAFNREAFQEARSFLSQGGILGVCPAGEVASFRFRSPEGWFKRTDHNWNASFVRIALDLELPIVPIHISGSNRRIYYVLRFFGRVFGRLANFRELVASTNQRILITVGEAIQHEEYKDLSHEEVARRVRENLYAAVNDA